MRPRKGNGTRADDKGDEVHDSSQSLYTGRIRKKRRSRGQAADEKILRKDDGGIEGEQGGSSCVGGHSARCLPYRLPSIRWEEKWSGRIALFL